MALVELGGIKVSIEAEIEIQVYQSQPLECAISIYYLSFILLGMDSNQTCLRFAHHLRLLAQVHQVSCVSWVQFRAYKDWITELLDPVASKYC
jgi:hypothetical protein